MSGDRAPSNGFVVSWFRPEANANLLHVWLTAIALIITGLFVAALVYLPGWVESAVLRGVALVGGLLMILGGLSYALVKSFRALGEEAYLLPRGDGLIFHRTEGDEAWIPWDEVTAARGDDVLGSLEIDQETGPTLVMTRRFVDIAPSALAKLIMDTRRKALMGLLRPP